MSEPTWRAVEQDAPGRLDPDGLEEAGVSERKLHHLLDLGQLLPAPANIIITDGVEGVLLVLEFKMLINMHLLYVLKTHDITL